RTHWHPHAVSPRIHCRVTCLEQNIVDGLNEQCLARGGNPEGLSAVTLQPEGLLALQEEERPTDAELEMLFPSVPWRDPIRISDFSGNFGFACRFCIARHGIRGCDVPSLSMSAREVRRHIRQHHPWSVGHKRRKRLRR